MTINTKGELDIVRAGDSDAQELADCMDAAYRPYMELTGGQLLPPMTVDYAVEIRECEVWVAKIGGELVGAIILSEADGEFQISNIAVHPNAQGKGVGKGLISFSIEQALKRNYSAVNLSTHPLLTGNVALYEHLGWSEVERDESHVFMTRSIR